jgi:signal transduction histidine kinase
LVDADAGAAEALLDRLGEDANTTLEGLRDLARGIFPPLLADQGIVPALEAHVRKVGANATIEASNAVHGRRFDADTEACVYFCCLQAIQNVIRHAGNAPCLVRLDLDDGGLVLSVRDTGPGFDADTTPPGMGRQIMMDRVDALDGRLDIEASPGNGTRVRIQIPVSAAEVAS